MQLDDVLGSGNTMRLSVLIGLGIGIGLAVAQAPAVHANDKATAPSGPVSVAVPGGTGKAAKSIVDVEKSPAPIAAPPAAMQEPGSAARHELAGDNATPVTVGGPEGEADEADASDAPEGDGSHALNGPEAQVTPVQQPNGTVDAAPATAAPMPAVPHDATSAPRNDAAAAPAAASAPAPAVAASGNVKPARDAEGRPLPQLNPLQEARPDRNVVVCEAGCGGTKIVFDGARARPVGEATPADLGHVKDARCRGGCYSNPTGFTFAGGHPAPSASLEAPPQLLDESAGRWMTTIVPAELPAKQSPAASSAPKPVDQKAKDRAKSNAVKPTAAKRDDWMTRINRAREEERGDKASDPAETAPAPKS